VLPRLILAIPHLVGLFFLSIALVVVVVIGWFAALVLGRLPGWAHQFSSDYPRWYTPTRRSSSAMGRPSGLDPRRARCCCLVLPGRGSLSASFSAW